MSGVQPLSALAAEPWRNGGGVTRTLARQGEQWRISLADIGRDGAYSSFAGLTRLSVIVAGAGLVLQDGPRSVTLMPGVAAVYDGAPAWQASLRQGACVALNVMARAGQYHLSARRLDGSAEVPAHAHALVLAWDGPARLSLGLDLPAQAFALLEPGSAARTLHPLGGTAAFFVLIEPLAPIAAFV
ncbi:HutD/Ves family protein [Bordetella genomosp. 12]|uniref:HutD family protein n=1 Tax=Bordetella genomosp. 12 TaxID=463035 RepID=A0A261VL78_9BORD|nr:HutD family protein [Bordetella genomosp. 12]OZI74845.1 hypothetical protein CAL22_10445 [Bordetella genomosp. 12]